ncbi:MAG: addiction module protein [Planctomycetaceae bacterium]
MSYEDLRIIAMGLSPQDRLDLADELFHSVSDEEIEQFDDDDDFELSPEQMAELERRIESVRDGTAVLIDADVALEQMRQALEERRSTFGKSQLIQGVCHDKDN